MERDPGALDSVDDKAAATMCRPVTGVNRILEECCAMPRLGQARVSCHRVMSLWGCVHSIDCSTTTRRAEREL